MILNIIRFITTLITKPLFIDLFKIKIYLNIYIILIDIKIYNNWLIMMTFYTTLIRLEIRSIRCRGNKR